jgi:hypothetical protein
MMQDTLAQNFFSESSQAIPSYNKAQLGNKSILPVPERIGYPQPQSTDMVQPETQSSYDLHELQSPHLESAMAFLGANANSHGWIIGRSAPNSSGFSRAQCFSNMLSPVDQPSMEIDDTASMSSSIDGPSLFSLYNASPTIDSFGGSHIKPGTVYPSLLEQSIVPSSCMAISSRAPAAHDSCDDSRPWHEIARNSNLVTTCSMNPSFSHDGLPNAPSASWSTQSEASLIWSQQGTPPGTISPQALSLVALSSSSMPLDNSPPSSSGWLSETSVTSQTFQEPVGDRAYPAVQSVRLGQTRGQGSDDDIPYARIRSARLTAVQIHSPGEDMADSKTRPVKSQGFQTVQPCSSMGCASIQSLMSQDFDHQRSMRDQQTGTIQSVISEADDIDRSISDPSPSTVVTVPSLGFQTGKAARRFQHPASRVLRPRRKLPATRVSDKCAPPLSSSAGALSRFDNGHIMAISDDTKPPLSSIRQHSKKISSIQRPLESEKSETTNAGKQVVGIMMENKPAPTLSGIEDTSQQRIAKDKFLLDSKRIGKSYKQIRLEGGFTEAESTLRGRHRTLTKKPEERVRKPEWDGNDVSPIFYV